MSNANGSPRPCGGKPGHASERERKTEVRGPGDPAPLGGQRGYWQSIVLDDGWVARLIAAVCNYGPFFSPNLPPFPSSSLLLLYFFTLLLLDSPAVQTLANACLAPRKEAAFR